MLILFYEKYIASNYQYIIIKSCFYGCVYLIFYLFRYFLYEYEAGNLSCQYPAFSPNPLIPNNDIYSPNTPTDRHLIPLIIVDRIDKKEINSWR